MLSCIWKIHNYLFNEQYISVLNKVAIAKIYFCKMISSPCYLEEEIDLGKLNYLNCTLVFNITLHSINFL